MNTCSSRGCDGCALLVLRLDHWPVQHGRGRLCGLPEGICAGGRDRFRTCGLYRVKRRPPSGRSLEPELTRADELVTLVNRMRFEPATEQERNGESAECLGQKVQRDHANRRERNKRVWLRTRLAGCLARRSRERDQPA